MVHVLVEGKKIERTICFAITYGGGALFLFTELLTNIYFPITSQMAKSLGVPVIVDETAAENWFRLWWPWATISSVSLYRFISLVVYEHFGQRGRYFFNVTFRMLVLCGTALIVTGEANPRYYFTHFEVGGPYYIYFIIYTISVTLLVWGTLIYSIFKFKDANYPNQGSSLKFFLLATVLSHHLTL